MKEKWEKEQTTHDECHFMLFGFVGKWGVVSLSTWIVRSSVFVLFVWKVGRSRSLVISLFSPANWLHLFWFDSISLIDGSGLGSNHCRAWTRALQFWIWLVSSPFLCVRFVFLIASSISIIRAQWIRFRQCFECVVVQYRPKEMSIIRSIILFHVQNWVLLQIYRHRVRIRFPNLLNEWLYWWVIKVDSMMY